MPLANLFAAMLLSLTGAALAEGLSPVAKGFHSSARLLAGGLDKGQHLAALEISLDDDFKTYWRNPGESGVPPQFEWTGSINVKSVEVLWPAPSRFEDQGGVAYGYHGKVIMPLRVTSTDPTQPVDLRLSLDYGICKDICIPAHAALHVTLPVDGTASAKDQALIREQGLAKVPQATALGAADDLAILSIAPVSEADLPRFIVKTKGPGQSTLFAEGPQDWYVATSPLRKDGSFEVAIEQRPRHSTGPALLRLTLVSDDKAIETDIQLDEALRPR